MRKTTVLIVEDSVSIGQQLKVEIEETLGISALVAESYKAAEKIMEERSEDIFLAILDLLLPDALENEIVDLAMSYDLPSVIFTSNLDDLVRSKAFSKNILDFVVKDRHAISNIASLLKWLQSNVGKKILVVDDSKSVRTMVSSRLASSKLEVLSACNGLEALQIVEDNPDLSMVITDYEMPEMDGLELVKRLRMRFSREELAIIGMSHVENKALTSKFLKSGASDFLSKPFEAEELITRVRINLESLDHVQKLKGLSEFKSTFLGMMAHDLKTPIGGISAISTLLRRELNSDLNGEHLEMLDVIYKESKDMNMLVGDLLDISAIEQGKLNLVKAEYKISELILRSLSLHRFSARDKGIELETRLDIDNAPSIKVDAQRFLQVVNNLVANALEYSPSGSTVVIKLISSSDGLVVSVKDQGPGLPEGTHKTGLGLTISKKIVEAHGGDIWLENNKCEGLTSSFSVPVV
ncbi:hybrid sensor histidine kinase/response regulator [Maridesulfovibrio frigidus]|uniref:hybrid sensor histidine kinase/response regulator n=1 Tax=Maridesulfovibrio frigidus TaxID=340956 RepID=UPI00068B7957|nr:hybrid sensor histidine kinase/response regulator [Maridesulfovibrio frigidus]